VTGPDLVRALRKLGFVATRQRGSHVQVRREAADGRVTTFPIPVHAGKSLKKGTLRGILRKAGLTVEDLIDLL